MVDHIRRWLIINKGRKRGRAPIDQDFMSTEKSPHFKAGSQPRTWKTKGTGPT